MSTHYNPNDQFIKSNLTEKEIMADFLKAHLPKSLLEKVDLSTLERVDTSHIKPF